MSKQKRHKPEEIASILTQHEAGLTTAEICRQYGISNQTLYRWKSIRRHGDTGSEAAKAA